MPSLTAPFVEVTQVVTGFMYQLHIAEETGQPGITRLDIGPYFFSGAPPQIRYPEAVTNELCPPDWQAVRWVTDEGGQSWLRWQGGTLTAEDGVTTFQLTSNYPAANTGAALHVFRGPKRAPDRFTISAPDYAQPPPANNSRHDVKGQAQFVGPGCAPSLVLSVLAFVGLLLLKHSL